MRDDRRAAAAATARWMMVDPDDASAVEAYNYAAFAGTDDFLAFRTALPVGSPAPDFAARLADDGQEVRLSDYWRGQDLLLEFGSLT